MTKKEPLTKELVLKALKANKKDFASPQEIAKRIGYYHNWNVVEMYLYELHASNKIVRKPASNQYEFRKR